MTGGRWQRAAIFGAAVVAALAIGVSGGVALAPVISGAGGSAAEHVTPSAVDIGFCQDMMVHHQQAVTIAQMTRGRMSPLMSALAGKIEASQMYEIGQMKGFLSLWNAPILPSDRQMSWMIMPGHGGGSHEAEAVSSTPTDAPMPGMATQDELNALGQATGPQLEVMFLQLMLRHHEGGLDMMRYAASSATVPAVRGLAEQMQFDQLEEIQQVNAFLEQRGGAPLPVG